MSTFIKKCFRGLSVLVLAVGLPLPLFAQTILTDITAEQIKKLAIEAILENPEIIQQAEQVLRIRQEQREAEARVEGLAIYGDEIIAGNDAVVLGNPDGDVTLVEFFDYNCGFCKRAGPVVKALLAEDENLRVVLREYPILNEVSYTAARAALAAAEQGKYQEFHEQIMAFPRISEASIYQLAETLGLDVVQLKVDMAGEKVAGHLNRTRQYTSALAINGTPAFILGGKVIAGFLPLEQMRERIRQAREGQAIEGQSPEGS